MLVLEKLRWKNLLSFGNTWTEIQLNRSPSTLVVGQSGSGKSTMIEALTFVLFGKPFRKILKNTLCNSINQKDCLVEIEFTSDNISYKIIRGLRPNVFAIYCNGSLVNQDPSVRDYQKYLDEHILGMNYKTFIQVVVLGYANHTPFMLLSSMDRRNTVDELLDTSIFIRMYRLLLAKNTELKNNLSLTENDISNLKSSIEVLLSNLNKLKSKEKSKAESIKTEIDKLQDTIDNLNVQLKRTQYQINGLTDLVSNHEHYKTKYSELSTIKSKFEVNKSKIDKELLFFKDNTSCPICLQGISHEHKEEMIKTRVETSNTVLEGVNRVKETAAKLKDKLDSYAVTLNEIVVLGNVVSSKNSEINTYQKVITQKQKELLDLSEGDSVVKDTEYNIDKLKENLSTSIERKQELITLRHYNEAAASLLKDEGIKARIIREYIPIINQLVNEYLSTMGMNVRFEFDESFEERILSRFRDELKYQNLSQGEQSRLSLAITLSWRKLAEARNSVRCNLLFLDEITDAAISAADMESVWSVIEETSNGNNVFIISHKPDLLSDKIYSTITMEKQGNFSKLI